MGNLFEIFQQTQHNDLILKDIYTLQAFCHEKRSISRKERGDATKAERQNAVTDDPPPWSARAITNQFIPRLDRDKAATQNEIMHSICGEFLNGEVRYGAGSNPEIDSQTAKK